MYGRVISLGYAADEQGGTVLPIASYMCPTRNSLESKSFAEVETQSHTSSSVL
jgi:hypothetical protein